MAGSWPMTYCSRNSKISRGLGSSSRPQLGGLGELLLDDLVAQVDALVADVDAWAGDELLDLLLALPAERALQQVAAVTDACHRAVLPSGRRRKRLATATRRAPDRHRATPPGRARRQRIGARHVGVSAVGPVRRRCRPCGCRGPGRPGRTPRPPRRSGSCRARCRCATCSTAAAGVLGEHLLQPRAHPQDLVGLDLDVGGLAVVALGVAGWWIRIRAFGRASRLPWVPGRQQHRRGRGRLAEADGLDRPA